jgi:NAD(P)-dependent dehydrogenase (short-subunit alcohol dehydrogenase family)
MKKKTVIVTGGSTGIGKATAITFAKKGYNVVISGRNEDKGKQAAQEIAGNGTACVFVKTDIRKEEDVIHLIDETVKTFGKLDVIVNNAGIAGDQSGFLADSTAENLRNLFDTNVLGLFFGMKYGIKAMLETGGGSVVNLASIAGANGLPYAAQYGASKHAVVGLTKAAAVEYATQGIRINAIAPGAIKTEILRDALDSGSYSEESIAALHPMNRMGKVEDIANGIAYLASDEAAFMTGNILFVDGGYQAK